MKQVNVAIGLIVFRGKILIGFRDQALHQGGCYEFPGGKVEQDETPEFAVKREIYEEVGINVNVIRLFHELIHEYSDRIVHLYFYTCTAVDVEHINPEWHWIAFDELTSSDFPAANREIITRLNWGKTIAITPVVDQLICKKIEKDIHQIYVRTENKDTNDVAKNLKLSIKDVGLIIKRDQYEMLPTDLKQHVFAIHLNSNQLHEELNLDQFKNINVIAACHHADDVKQANKLGCDAIFLSPVNTTTTHPEHSNVLGWDQFGRLSLQAYMPVYALGGIKMSDLAIAQKYGAYGVAGISDFWIDQKET